MTPYYEKFYDTVEGITRKSPINFTEDQIQDNAKRLCILCSFLNDNPQLLSWRSKKDIPSLTNKTGIEAIATKYFKSKFKTDYPAEPGTSPDEIVSLVMQIVYKYTKVQTEEIKVSHLRSMSAENIVGGLLERYIASVMEAHDWVWCAGDFVKAADFLHFKNGKWLVLQVKNRDNTENSSSSAIRNGTEIQKWFRTYSKTGLTNWAAFPDAEFRGKLSEDGFEAYVKTYLREAR